MTEQTLTLTGAQMRAEVWTGLNRSQKELSPKWFYDAAGSALFDEITRLLEYYPTRTERGILAGFGRQWIRTLRARTLIELGAGSAEKTRLLLEAMPTPGSVYVPVDISETYLDAVATELAHEFPDLDVRPAQSDIARELHVPSDLPGPRVFAFLGSTIGNFEPHAAVQLLRRVRAALEPEDRFLMGADLVKDPVIIERAYNDARGVTAAFNRNVLHVLNREIDTDFDPDAFVHHAFYAAESKRIEMHLVARTAQRVTIPDMGSVEFRAGESIRTEISCKYDRPTVQRLFNEAGLAIERWETDSRGWFALVVGRAAERAH